MPQTVHMPSEVFQDLIILSDFSSSSSATRFQISINTSQPLVGSQAFKIRDGVVEVLCFGKHLCRCQNKLVGESSTTRSQASPLLLLCSGYGIACNMYHLCNSFHDA